MLLQEPANSPYDLQFQLLGFPIRVSWSFWLGSFVFGFYVCQGMEAQLGDAGPGLLALYALWMACVLVSITIHELGHALAFRQYGIQSSIVLYHFGGLAIPQSSIGGARSYGQLGPREELWIALAGPLAQLVSAVIVIGGLMIAGYHVPEFAWWPLSLLAEPLGISGGKPLYLDSAGLFVIATFYMLPSVLWAILNLVPVWPLDGGRISRSLVLLGGGNTSQALLISLIVGGAMAVYGFTNGQMFLGILFLSLAITNYQMLQQSGSWRF